MPCPHSGGGINMSFSRSLIPDRVCVHMIRSRDIYTSLFPSFVIIHSFLPGATYTSLKHEFKYVHLLRVYCQSFS